MPMTNDIVGDIPRSDSVLEVSSSSPTSFSFSFFTFFINFFYNSYRLCLKLLCLTNVVFFIVTLDCTLGSWLGLLIVSNGLPVIGLGCLRLDIVGEVKVTYEKILNNKKNSLNHANERFGTLFLTQRLPLVGAFRILKLGLTILFLFWEESLMFTKV